MYLRVDEGSLKLVSNKTSGPGRKVSRESMTFRKAGCINVSFAVWPVALLLLLTIAAPVFAQNAAGTILGVVKDSQGGAVTGATVTVRSTESGLTRELKTTDDGSYRAPAMPVGNYSIKAEASGFKTATDNGVVLTVASEAQVNFSLEVGTASQQVVVTGEAAQVETTNATLDGTVDEQRMARLSKLACWQLPLL
jgi:hypothetical protein